MKGLRRVARLFLAVLLVLGLQAGVIPLLLGLALATRAKARSGKSSKSEMTRRFMAPTARPYNADILQL